MLKGSIVAIVSPMDEDGKIDFDSFGGLIDWHVSRGTNALVVVGTTGESPTVDYDEHCKLIEFAVGKVAKRIPVVAGTGANSTSEAIELSIFAKNVGADFSLSVVPYYNKPSQDGLYRHFKAVAEAVDIPQILYNVPGRTVADLATDTIIKLSEIPNIVGLKDATADLERGAKVLKLASKDFAVYSGDDGTSLALMLMGGHGVISVTANVVPEKMSLICESALGGEYQRAISLNNMLINLNECLFLEANPIPVKWALFKMGMIKNNIRLPLTSLSEIYKEKVTSAMLEAGVELA